MAKGALGGGAKMDPGRPRATALEITILWGSTVLRACRVTRGRGFTVGEAPRCDFVLPAVRLGTDRLPVVVWERTGWVLVVPTTARGHVLAPDAPGRALAELRTDGRYPLDALGRPRIPLPSGVHARLELAEFALEVAAVTQARPRRGMGRPDLTLAGYFAGSLLAHAALAAAVASSAAPLGLNDDETSERSRLRLMQQYLGAAAEREREVWNPESVPRDVERNEGGTGTRSKGEESALGKTLRAGRGQRFAVKGPPSTTDPRLARTVALDEAARFGMIGLVAAATGATGAPTAPWARDFSLTADASSASGNLWGNAVGDAWGSGGLALSGTGEGGGGRGEGIGLGSLGGWGNGAGIGAGQGFGPGDGGVTLACGCGWASGAGMGSGHGRVGGSHRALPPRLRTEPIRMRGHLPAEVVQRVVRQNQGRFLACYQDGLAQNPTLEGRVSVRFVIEREGSVASAVSGGSDLPDSSVVRCAVRVFQGMTFPAPEGGIVTVEYPIRFTPT